jgi:predicted nucleic acid-binding protein
VSRVKTRPRSSADATLNDLWIAALVLQHDLILCTSDQHFRQLPQIPLHE